jgi:hypothetical protein
MNNEFNSKFSKLVNSRKLVAKFTKVNHEISTIIAGDIRAKARSNNVTLKELGYLTDIPMHSIVNWLCGSSMHVINEEAAKKMWQTLRKVTIRQSKLKEQLDSVTDAQFRKLSSRKIAVLVGCSSSAVIRYMHKYKKPKYKSKYENKTCL